MIIPPRPEGRGLPRKIDDYLHPKGEVAKNILNNPYNFNLKLDKEANRFHSLSSSTRYTFNISVDRLKIELNNQKLVDKIRILVYKDYVKDVSYYYGYTFFLVFLFVFTVSTFFIEQACLERKVKNYSPNMVFGDDISTGLFQPLNSLFYFIITVAIFLVIGLIISVVPFYISGTDSLSFPVFLNNLVKPINTLSFIIGYTYIQNVPLSRVFLLVLMPLLIALYMVKASPLNKFVDKAEKAGETK